MKSTLKIHEFEIILDGVGEQWLKQNHQHIIQAIHEAFQPFDNRNFDESVIDEIEIHLPPSNSFNDFLIALISQLRSQIVDKYVLSVSNGTQINEAKTNVTNWNTIETLFNQLQYQLGSNSNLTGQTLHEISQNISNNSSLIWQLLEKLGLSREIFQAFQKWAKSEKISPNIMLYWMLQFLQNNKNNKQESADTIFLKTIFFSQFKNNVNLVSFSKINSDFVNQILKLQNSELTEYLTYENSAESINALFSNYINEIDLIKNSIDVGFIHKLFKLNTTHFSQYQEPQKKEVLLYFNILKIANSLNLVNYQQLIAELNFYYFNVSNHLFDFEQIIQIFQKYIPANQFKSLDSLLEMVFQETKLINFNLNIESTLAELFKKIDLFISDNFVSNIIETSPDLELKNQDLFQIEQSEILTHIIQIHWFKNWPKELVHFIPVWTQEIVSVLKSGGTSTFKISASIENEAQLFILKELNQILQLAISNNNQNQIKLEDFVLGYRSIVNLLLINLAETVWNAEQRISDSKDSQDIHPILDLKAESIVPQNETTFKRKWTNLTRKLKKSKYAVVLDQDFLKSIEKLSESDLFQYLKRKFNVAFAENFISAIHHISSIENDSFQSKIVDQLAQWLYIHTASNLSDFYKNELITFDLFNQSLNRIDFDTYLQSTKHEIVTHTISLVEELSQLEETNSVLDFTAEELTLWNSLIELTQENKSNFIKRFNQIQYFAEIIELLQKNWITTSKFRDYVTADFQLELPQFYLDLFDLNKENSSSKISNINFNNFLQLTNENQIFRFVFLGIISKLHIKYKNNFPVNQYLSEQQLTLDNYFNFTNENIPLINADFIEYFLNTIFNFDQIPESESNLNDRLKLSDSANVLNFEIENILESIRFGISSIQSDNAIQLEKILLTFIHTSPLSHTIYESIRKLEEKFNELEKFQQTSEFLKMGIEAGYFNILQLFIQDLRLQFPIEKIEQFKKLFDFTDNQIKDFELQLNLFQEQLQSEIQSRISRLTGKNETQSFKINPFQQLDISDQFVMDSWFNFETSTDIEPSVYEQIELNYVNQLQSDDKIISESVSTNLSSDLTQNQEKRNFIGSENQIESAAINENNIIPKRENLESDAAGQTGTETENFERLTREYQNEFFHQVIALLNPIIATSEFIDDISGRSQPQLSEVVDIQTPEKTDQLNLTTSRGDRKDNTKEVIEIRKPIQEWMNQLELQNQSLVFSIADIQSILRRIKSKWFKFIKPFAVKNDLQRENKNHFYAQILEQENQFNGVTHNPLFLKIPNQLNTILNYFIQEIDNIQPEEFTLKNYILFQSLFELITQVIEKSLIIPNIEEPNFQKIKFNKVNIIDFFKTLIFFQKDKIMPLLTEEYLAKNEFEIAKETKSVTEIHVKSEGQESESLHPMFGNNLWFQSELKIDTSSIFSEQSNWKYLFNKQKAPIFIQNEIDSQLISENLNDADKLLLLINHPNYKKWTVVMGRNNAEGYMDLSSQISLDAITQAQNEKFKGYSKLSINYLKIFNELKSVLTSTAVLSLYQLTKFQFLQVQTPITVLQIAEQLYTSYLSVESEKTLNEIIKVAQIIKDNLPFTDSEIQLFNQIVNQQLPNQTSSTITNTLFNEIEKSVVKLTSKNHLELATIASHVIKYPSISEKEIIAQFDLVFDNFESQTTEQKKAVLNQISKEIWSNLKEFHKNGILKKESQKFIQKIVQNWLEFKEIHWTVVHGFSSIQQWLDQTQVLLSVFVQLHNQNTIHPSWNFINKITEQKPVKKLNEKTIAFEISIENQFSIENGNSHFNQITNDQNPQSVNAQKINLLEIDVIQELKSFKAKINEPVEIISKKAIENQQNKEEEALVIPIKPKIPNILDWEILTQSNNDINQSILSILLIEGLQLKNKVNLSQSFPLGINEFLSGKAFFRIMGHSSIPLQMIGLLYEGYFGYSMGMLDENWNQFVNPQHSKTLIDKLRTLRNVSEQKDPPESWFDLLLTNAENNPNNILSTQNFKLIIDEISEIIGKKLQETRFSKSHESLKKKWISQLIFFKLIQYKDSETEIGGYFSLLASEPNKIDYWIHKISDHILFDISVEYDFWINYISQLGNYFSESNVLTLFQFSESLKILNKENKLKIEDVLIKVLQTTQNRSFNEATLTDLIPELIPLFYENQLSKTTQFRELMMLALILNERNDIGISHYHETTESIELTNLFESFNQLENTEIDQELLREITIILGKNTDVTSRWILSELANSDAQKLHRITAKIQESYQTTTKIPNLFQSLLNHPEGAAAIQDIILPITINLKDKPKIDSKIKREIENGTRFLSSLCGLMLLAPFLSTLFRRMGLLDKNEFISEIEQLKAYKVLMTIPKLDEEESYEYQDLIPRIITGIAPEDTINFIPELTEEEITELRNFLGAVISQWPAMSNSTLRGFIESFLVRDGKVWKEGKVWKIEVNGHGADIILQTLTWGFATMKFPWTPYMIETDWKAP